MGYDNRDFFGGKFEDQNGDTYTEPGKTFWCYYCLCSGCGFNGPFTHGIYARAVKQLFCKGSYNVEICVNTDNPEVKVVCGEVSSCCCIWRECQCMLEPGNPKVACCTKKLNNDEYKAPDPQTLAGYQGPGQLEMQ